MFRKLKASEIECRIGQVSKTGKGLSLLLYKDARADMIILDETVGALNWKREHTRDNANCIVSIWNDKIGQWVSKEDTGTESFTEKEKGQASDSFKRTCVNWGIGRELYTSPFIWIKSSDCEINQYNGKYTCSDKFEVKDISYDDDGNIKTLTIINNKNKKIVFGSNTSSYNKLIDDNKENKVTTNSKKLTNGQLKRLFAIAASVNVSMPLVKAGVLRDYKVNNLEELTKVQYDELCKKLEAIAQ